MLDRPQKTAFRLFKLAIQTKGLTQDGIIDAHSISRLQAANISVEAIGLHTAKCLGSDFIRLLFRGRGRRDDLAYAKDIAAFTVRCCGRRRSRQYPTPRYDGRGDAENKVTNSGPANAA